MKYLFLLAVLALGNFSAYAAKQCHAGSDGSCLKACAHFDGMSGFLSAKPATDKPHQVCECSWSTVRPNEPGRIKKTFQKN